MKQILIISLVLIFLLACEDENPVAPKYIISTDSLYISQITPEFGISGQEILISGKGFGADTSKVNVFFGDSVIYATFLSDSLIKINVPNFVAGKFKISVKVHDSIAYSPIDFEIISINNKFSKIEVWFNNFICNYHHNYNAQEFPEGTTVEDTTYEMLYKSAYFLFDKSYIPKRVVLLDSSNQNIINIRKFHIDTGNASSFYCVINEINQEINDIKTSYNKSIQYGNPNEITGASLTLNRAKFIRKKNNEIECNISFNDLLISSINFSRKDDYSFNQSHNYYRRYSDYLFISLTDSSSVKIVLTPE